jgi:flagellar assembly protein FliH
MALIRRDNVVNGDPVPIRFLSTRPEGEEEGDEASVDAGANVPGLEYEQREEHLRQWAARLKREQAEIDAARAAAREHAERDAARLADEGRARGEEARATIVSEAQQQAATILAEAADEGEQIRARAEAEGFQAGIHQAEEETSARLRELRESIDAVVDEAHYQRVNLIRNAEEQVVALALEAARRIAGDALRDDAAFVALVRAALGRMLDKDWVRIRVSREDLERVRGLEDRFRAAVSGLDHVEVVEDGRVDHGLLLETRHGTVDATVAGQMRELLLSVERALEAEAESAAAAGGEGP